MEKSKLEKLELDIKKGFIATMIAIFVGIFFYLNSGKKNIESEINILLLILFAYSIYSKDRYSITVFLFYCIMGQIFQLLLGVNYIPRLLTLIWGFFSFKACWAIFQFHRITNIEPTKTIISKLNRILITILVVLFILGWILLKWEKELETFLGL